VPIKWEIIMAIRAAIAFQILSFPLTANEFGGQQDNCGYNYMHMYYYL
jgi:hypothetical protein